MRALVDTNVWAYLYDPDAPGKRDLAASLVRNRSTRIMVSTQVLQELYSVLRRKMASPLSHDQASGAVDSAAGFEVIGSDADLVRRAIRTVHDHQLSIWDALILEAAVRGRCTTLFTEDLAAGTTIRGVEIVNPFA